MQTLFLKLTAFRLFRQSSVLRELICTHAQCALIAIIFVLFSAYSDSSDFATSSGSRFLSKHNIDTVGIGSTTLNLILPTNQYSGHSISSLQKWFSSGYAYHKYRKTPDYYALRSRKIRKGGARPFLFLRNIMGTCDPYCQRVNCLSKGGTPKSSNGGSNSGNNFSWWSTLITGYLKLALKADPDINTVHIWNEPDTV